MTHWDSAERLSLPTYSQNDRFAPARRSRWPNASDGRDDRLARLYLSPARPSLHEAGAAVGITRARAKQILNARGIDTSAAGRTWARIERALDGGAGYDAAAIAKAAGLASDTVREHCREHGITLAPGRGRGSTLIWPRERIIAAMKEWAKRNGRPPTAPEWVQSGPDHPSVRSVQYQFGSWNAGIQAAGFEPMKPGQRRGNV